MSAESWLERWLSDIITLSARQPLLELGCGTCEDTAYLERHGLRVVAGDLDAERLAVCARQRTQASLLCLDLRSPLPFMERPFTVVLASLCLHYFTWSNTVHAVREIHRCLVDGGLLLCRVNSIKDVKFGAVGHPAIDAEREGAYYQVGDRSKRFFDEFTVRSLFAHGWAFESLDEQTILRYERSKVIWEAALRKKGEF